MCPVVNFAARVSQELLGESDFARRNDGGVVIPTPLLHLTTRYGWFLYGSLITGEWGASCAGLSMHDRCRHRFCIHVLQI